MALKQNVWEFLGADKPTIKFVVTFSQDKINYDKMSFFHLRDAIHFQKTECLDTHSFIERVVTISIRETVMVEAYPEE